MGSLAASVFDLNEAFNAIKTGGPAVIFVLLLVLGLLLTGQLRPKASVEAEQAHLERAHAAELATRDRQIADTVRAQERLQERVEREHELFEQALTVIRQDLMPMLRSSLPRGSRQ